MKITCTTCGFEGNISDKLIPDEGRSVGCPRCGGRFFIKKPRVSEVKDPVRDLVEEKRLRHDPSRHEEGDIVSREWEEFYGKIERLATLAKRKRIPLIIKKAEDVNESQSETVNRIKREVFDINPKEKNMEIEDLATKIVRIQGSFNAAEREKRQVTHNPDVVGVRLRYQGDRPDVLCPSRACEEAVRTGKNVEKEGQVTSADFYFGEMEVPWFPHCPHCFCEVERYLHEDDLNR